jgi:hypothetical protein
MLIRINMNYMKVMFFVAKPTEAVYFKLTIPRNLLAIRVKQVVFVAIHQV